MPLRNDFINDYLDFIYRSAKEYENNLLNKDFLFVAEDKGSFICYKPSFLSENFPHLVGVKPYPRSKNYNTASKLFYGFLSKEKPILNRDFYFTRTENFLTKKKNAEIAFRITENATMTGVLNEKLFKRLKTDRLFGNELVVVGFFDKNKGLVPNTLLNDCIKRISKRASLKRIIATLQIKKNNNFEVKYINENISIFQYIKISDLIYSELNNRLLESDLTVENFREKFIESLVSKNNEIVLSKSIDCHQIMPIAINEGAASLVRPSLDDEINSARNVSNHLKHENNDHKRYKSER